jgi:hypothetical protein
MILLSAINLATCQECVRIAKEEIVESRDDFGLCDGHIFNKRETLGTNAPSLCRWPEK